MRGTCPPVSGLNTKPILKPIIFWRRCRPKPAFDFRPISALAMDANLRAAVRQRAAERCEYCHRLQADSPLISFHIEHIVARKHDGSEQLDNLALACPDCNLRKGSNLTGIDPDSSSVTRLFDPRVQNWDEHFVWEGLRIVGQTAIGRTTVRVLDLNSPARLRLRLGDRLSDRNRRGAVAVLAKRNTARPARRGPPSKLALNQ